jgi:hypothetical protein
LTFSAHFIIHGWNFAINISLIQTTAAAAPAAAAALFAANVTLVAKPPNFSAVYAPKTILAAFPIRISQF